MKKTYKIKDNGNGTFTVVNMKYSVTSIEEATFGSIRDAARYLEEIGFEATVGDVIAI